MDKQNSNLQTQLKTRFHLTIALYIAFTVSVAASILSDDIFGIEQQVATESEVISPDTKPTIVSEANHDTFNKVSQGVLEVPLLIKSIYFQNRLKENAFMTTQEKLEYVDAIKIAKKKFPKVPSTLIHATGLSESDLNPRARHPNRSDHGVCGINYKYNGQALRHAKIITCEKDLNKISNNVLACAFLYNQFLIDHNRGVFSAIVAYKGTNVDGRSTKLYTLYRNAVALVQRTLPSQDS